MLPVTPVEWRKVGIDSDLKAFHLMKYLYGIKNINDNNDLCLNIPHDNCIELMAPSTLMKIGEKFLQLAATNCTDGGHYNTRSYN